MDVKRTERGWPAHYCCARRCVFHRNTLLECGKRRVVVSSVGAFKPDRDSDWETIGSDRYYETMAFRAHKVGIYWEADVSKELDFPGQWTITEKPNLPDAQADEMHEDAVAWFTDVLAFGSRLRKAGE